MKVFTAETKVGLLTIVAVIALVYMSFRTVGVPMFGDEKHMSIHAKFQSVAGIDLRSKVNLSGVEIGYVDNITLEDGYALVTIKLTRAADIRRNSVATIRTFGLLGEKYIELVQGTPDAPLLKDGEEISRVEEGTDIGDIARKLSLALDDIQVVTHSIRNVFGTMESESALKNILHNIEDASANMKAVLAENRNALRATLGNLSDISGEFAKNAPEISRNLAKLSTDLLELIENNKDNLSAGIANIRDVSGEFKGVIKENRKNLKITLDSIAAASAKLGEVMDSVKKMSQSIENVASKVERGEGTVGKLVTDDAVYTNLNNTLVGARKFLNRMETLRIQLGFRGEAQTDINDTKAFFTFRIQPREDKYYLLEISEDSRMAEEDKSDNPLRNLLYTIMIAKRYSDITIRGGIMESSAGAGVSYHMFDDRVALSTDIFNLSGYDDDAPDPQLKVQLKFNLQKYIYLYMGGDELLNEKYRTFLVGGGILFDEDDLKIILGLL